MKAECEITDLVIEDLDTNWKSNLNKLDLQKELGEVLHERREFDQKHGKELMKYLGAPKSPEPQPKDGVIAVVPKITNV